MIQGFFENHAGFFPVNHGVFLINQAGYETVRSFAVLVVISGTCNPHEMENLRLPANGCNERIF